MACGTAGWNNPAADGAGGGRMSIGYLAKDLGRRCLDALLPRRKVLAELRAQWGRPGAKCEPLAGHWYGLVRADVDGVDDKTWDDLEFPRLFADLDTTVTPLGSQVLYRRLREYVEDPAELAARHAVHERLAADRALRERLQLALWPLRASSHAQVADALFGEPPEPLPGRGLLSLWAAFSLVLLLAVVAYSWSAWWWLAVLPINAVILYRCSWRSLHEIEALKACLQMLRVADTLSASRAGDVPLPQLERLRAERAHRDEARRALWLLGVLKREPLAYVAVWLNIACLLELVVHLWTVGRFQRLRGRLHPSFELVGGLDAALALASALAMYPRHCQPLIAPSPRLEIVDGRHPLLAGGVANSIRLDGRGVLVTGSNMAGKTTFVKMLGINAILGRTAGFCLAARAVLPSLRVMAAIHGVHSVESGKSHYFAEIETIRAFLGEAEKGGGLFVIDEPFSGTNTVERVAIARAVLQALGDRSLALVTTHDVELQAMLQDRYELCHFQEDPDAPAFFDYRMRPGPAVARNAIRLLARVGFPRRVVDDAMVYAGERRQT